MLESEPFGIAVSPEIALAKFPVVKSLEVGAPIGLGLYQLLN